MDKPRLRFAPSPTGYLHIGGLRTALYNYFYTKKHDGTFVIRIEDTDRTRYVEGAIENLLHQLEWAGIEIDEGVMLDENEEVTERGPYGPYIQSDRVKEGLYDKYVDELLDKDAAYYCFCSAERLDDLREQQRADGVMTGYDGLCRGISREEAKERVAAGEEHVVRLKLPEDQDIVFDDVVKGRISINTNDMDDQVLIKSDGFPTYHFAVVVDDHLMKISHIVRGDEWISSVPKHILIYEAFGWDIPEYVHLPTVLNKEGKKLSKRNADVAVEDFRKMGYTPEGLNNYLALLGWAPQSTQEILSLEELVDQFTYERVQRSGAIFDIDKLNWVNAHYIKDLSNEKVGEEVKPFLLEAGLISEDSDINLALIGDTFHDSLQRFDQIVDQSRFLFENIELTDEAKEMVNDDMLTLRDAYLEELEKVDEVDEEFASTIMKKLQEKTGFKGRQLFMPTRVLVTGRTSGPDLSHVIQILGKEELVKRLKSFG